MDIECIMKFFYIIYIRLITILGIIMDMMTFETNWRKAFELFFLKHGKRLSNLKDFTHKVDHFVQVLDMWSTGRLSQTLIHPRQLLRLLRKVVHDVTMKNSQFVPLYTELYNYYETHSVSFTNTEDYLIIQILIFSLITSNL